MKVFRKLMGAALLAVVALSGVSANAAGLFAPLGLDSASVMPKGVRSFRIAGFSSEMQDKYNAVGSIVPLADAFNKPVTWGELIDSRPDPNERGYLRGGLQSEGIQMSDTLGDAYGLVNARLTSTVPVFAYGITERITLGVGVPVVYSKTHVATGWSISPSGQAQLDGIKMSGNGARVESYSSLLYNVVNTKIASYGYKPLVGEENTDIGDVTLGLKILAHQQGKLAFVVAPKVVMPTGREPDVDKVVDLAPGGGIWQTGVSAIAEYAATHKFSVVGSAGYTYQWAANKAARVPRAGTESISPDVDYNVNKKLGDISALNAGAKYKFTELVTGGVGYSLSYKDQDRYRGSLYSAHRYGYLEQDTWQSMHAVLGSVSFSTIPLYQAGKFAVPGDVSFALSSVVEGRNVTKATLAILELAAYF